MVLEIQAGLFKVIPCYIGSSYQSRTASAAIIVNCDKATFFDLFRNIANRRKRHEMTNIVRGKYLFEFVASESHPHIDFTKKILVRIFLQRDRHFGKKLRE